MRLLILTTGAGFTAPWINGYNIKYGGSFTITTGTGNWTTLNYIDTNGKASASNATLLSI